MGDGIERLVFLTVILFLLVKTPNIQPKLSVENVYFYMAKLVGDGLTPYRDFFFAHPPLHVYFLSVWMKIFNDNIAMTKMIAVLESIVSAILLYRIAVKKKFNPAYAFPVLYLFSFTVLATTDYSTGVHLTSMLLLTGVFLLEEDRPLPAGAACGLASLSRLYAIPAILGLLLYLVWFRRGLRLFLWGLIPVLVLGHGLFLLSAGDAYIDQVFKYHLLKPASMNKGNVFRFFLVNEPVLIFSVLLSPLILRGRMGEIIPAYVTCIPLFGFYLFFQDIYYYYLLMAIPYMALVTGQTLRIIFERIQPGNKFLIPLVLLAFTGYNTYSYLGVHAPAGRVEFITELAYYVKTNTVEEDTLYGSNDIAPLVALYSGRKIHNNYVDTDYKLFQSGLHDRRERTSELAQGLDYIILKAAIIGDKIVVNEDFAEKSFVSQCLLVKKYDVPAGYSANAILVMDCRPDAT